MIRKVFFRSIAILYLFSQPCQATVTLAWQSSSSAEIENSQSDGLSSLTTAFTFELGGFRGTFTPTADNTDQWAANWTAIGSASYRENTQSFSETALLENNDDPFLTTKAVYIWGRNGLTEGSEWILVTRAQWSWPTASGGLPLPGGGPSYIINPNDNYDVILGAVNENGFLMQTTRIGEGTPYENWVAANFSEQQQSNPNIIGQNEDPDGDGRVNLLEFATGGNPNKNDTTNFLTISQNIDNGNEVLNFEIRRAANTGITWTLEQSAANSLSGFEDITPQPVTTTDEPTRLILQIPQASAEKRFYRIRAEEE